jgi:hypothetical protein
MSSHLYGTHKIKQARHKGKILDNELAYTFRRLRLHHLSLFPLQGKQHTKLYRVREQCTHALRNSGVHSIDHMLIFLNIQNE